jgi:hypothetical protein
VGISDKKIIPRKTEEMKQMVISDRIPTVLRKRKFTEFRSEPFRGRENNSEFRSMDQKKKQTLGIPFPIHQWKRKQLGIPIRVTKIEANSGNSVPNRSETTRNKTQ